MRIQETNQILKESNLERLDAQRRELDKTDSRMLQPRNVGIGLAVAALAVGVGVMAWRSYRQGEVSLFKL